MARGEDRANTADARGASGRSPADVATLPGEGIQASDGHDPARAAGEQTPSHVGRFAILRLLGEGGVGRVFAAYDETLDRRVAIKVLQAAGRGSASERILREARAMAKLSHPNVVPVFEVGEHGGQPFLAMEYVEGQTLAQWQTGRVWSEVLEVYAQAGEGLAAAHAQGLIHRDFKPHNVVIDSGQGTPRARVLDFGLVQLGGIIESDAGGGLSTETDPEQDRLTATGRVLGTPAYMAPEQVMGQPVSAAADQFSFCVSLWEALYGERPFQRDSLAERIGAVVSGEAPNSPARLDVPGWLREVVLRGLAARPEDRHPSMAELVESLRRDRRRRRRLATGGAIVVAAAAVGGVVLQSPPPTPDPCDAGAALGDAWSDTRRTEVERAFEQYDAAVSGPAWERVRDSIDPWVERWQDMFTERCRAGERRDDGQEVRLLELACLERSRALLDAVSASLVSADEQVVARAGTVTVALPRLSACEDSATLRRNDLEPPREEDQEAVARARRSLDDCWAALAAGRNEEAVKYADEAYALALTTEYAPVHAEVLAARGYALEWLGRHVEAERVLLEALHFASASAHRTAVHSAANSLLLVVGGRLGKPDEGRRYWPLAIGNADSKAAQANAYNNLGVVFFSEGRYAESESSHREALRLREEALGDNDALVGLSLTNIALTLRRRGRYEEAEALARRALAVHERSGGPNHPWTMRANTSLAIVLSRLGRYEESIAQHRRGLEVSETMFGDESIEVARSLHSLATVLEVSGRYEEAKSAAVRGMAIRKQIGFENAVRNASARTTLANAQLGLGELAEAEAGHREALAVREQHLGPTHAHLAYSLTGLARALLAQGRPEQAEPLAARAWEIRQSAETPPARKALTAFTLAQAIDATGPTAEREVRALAFAREALVIYEEIGDAHAADLATVQAWLDAR